MIDNPLPETWRWTTLGDVADSNGRSIVSGPFGSNIGSRFFVEHGTPVIRGNNLTTDWRRFIDTGFVFVSEDKANELRNCDAIADDLIFTAAGSLGQVGLIPHNSKYPRYIISNKQMRARLDTKRIYPLFAFYWFSSAHMVEYVRQRNTGSSVPLINLSVLRSLPLPLPPLSQQRAIAHILGTLDDKIELNRRMSETLEEMARALFKSWFVDFDPVRAKAEGRDPGIHQSIADLFPDSFEDSEIGEIPDGWSLGTLADHCDAMKGVSYKGSGLGDEGVPLHNLNSVFEGGGYKYEGIKYYSGEYGERHIVRPGDVIVANTEQGHERRLIGFAALVPSLFGATGIASHHIFILKAKPQSPFTSNYLHGLINSRRMHEIVSGYANGTTVNMLPIDGVQKPTVVRPPERLIEAYDRWESLGVRRREAIQTESQTLASLRDTLLPKLISGELRVRDAERFVDVAL